VPAEFLAAGFADMNPVNTDVTKYVQLYRKLDNGPFVENFDRMERWLREDVDVAGETYVQFIEGIYHDKALYKNELTPGGIHVGIQNIDMLVIQVVGEFDNLIPPTASKPFNDVIPSDDTEIVEFPSGHVGLAVSDKTHTDLWPRVCEWLEQRS
jgi:polyhydroxyalkanoate synthase